MNKFTRVENQPVTKSDLFEVLLAILFIGLKIAAIISWSWWLVLIPTIYIIILGVIKEILLVILDS